jgi:hypothetical protein
MKNAGSVETVASAADAKTIPCGIVTRPVRKVLLPVDFSKPSIASVGYGTALALRAGAALHLIRPVQRPARRTPISPSRFRICRVREG